MNSKSMLAIFPIQDLFACQSDLCVKDVHEERINVPANRHHYWKYRIHLTMEELIKNDQFTLKIKDMLKASRRYHNKE